MNVDAAIFKEKGTCSIGVVIRNHQGQIMGAMCKKLEFSLEALEAEAKVMEAGILFTWDLWLKDIIIEGDAQLIIQDLNLLRLPYQF